MSTSATFCLNESGARELPRRHDRGFHVLNVERSICYPTLVHICVERTSAVRRVIVGTSSSTTCDFNCDWAFTAARNARASLQDDRLIAR